MTLTVTICGGGNGAHTAAACLSSEKVGPKVKVNVFTRQPEKWSKEIKVVTGGSSWEGMGDFSGTINKASSDASQVVPEADILLVCAPANANRPILTAIAPHIKKGALLGTLFGQGAFDWCVRQALGDKTKDLKAFFGFTNIPWLCRIQEYGKVTQMIGPKKQLWVAVSPLSEKDNVAKEMASIFSIPTFTVPNFMTLTLSPSNQIIHPARYYAIFKNYDGSTPVPESDIQWGLYNEFDDLAAEWLQKLSDELQKIRMGLAKRYPELDLSKVLPIKERIEEHYGKDVTDKSSLKMVMRTNQGYAGCVTPAIKVEGGFKPAVASRLFWEDIPFGLCILRNIAEMLNQETPSIDFMIEWHQKYMGKEFLKNGQLNRELIAETGAPEAYGIKTLDEMVKSSLDTAKSL